MHEIINSLFNYAMDNDILVEYTNELSPKTQSFSDINSRAIVINANWKPQSQIPFIIAHEISHLLQCDENDAQLSETTLLNSHFEQKANVNAIRLLTPFYCDGKDPEQINVSEFMKLFSIPNYFKDICESELKESVK